MSAPSFYVQSRRVVFRDGVRPAAIRVDQGKITSVHDYDQIPEGAEVIDGKNLVLMPGIIDAHVHINDPGRSHWENFETATRAAASGGVTTLVEMPLNSIPTTNTPEALHTKTERAKNKLHVDLGLWGGFVPDNANARKPLFEAGVLGFKCFLSPSGVDEFHHVTPKDLQEGLPELASLGARLLVHAEHPGFLRDDLLAAHPPLQRRVYKNYLASRPPLAELEAIKLLIALSRETGAAIHIVHLATEEALPLLRQARQEGLPITVETCPHYLTFSAEEIPDGATSFKCAPPIRASRTREALWEALREGIIDLVASDHSPAPPEIKAFDSGRFDLAWGGISSMQWTLPLTWSGASSRGFDLTDLHKWLCLEPAKLAALAHQKGQLAPGFDADFLLWDPDTLWTPSAEDTHHLHKRSPYLGRPLQGKVQRTWLRGQKIYDNGHFSAPTGRWLNRREP